MEERFHSLLTRQLKRIRLNTNELPKDIETWISFLDHINNAYIQNDEDRYTLERSLEISGKEMKELYEVIEETQAMSKIGSWIVDPKLNKVFWSTETYRILHYPEDVTPSLELLFARMASEDEKDKIIKANKKILKGQRVSIESRLNIEEQEIWVENRGHPFFDPITHHLIRISGVIIDITERKITELKLQKLNKELIVSARRAGMSDIAVNILHNIGNILNSVNVINDFIYDKISNSKISNMSKGIELLKKNIAKHDNDFMLTTKGFQTIEYFEQLSHYWSEEQASLLNEVKTLKNHIKKINNVVKMQQAISGVVGHVEYTNLHEAMDDALMVVLESIRKRNIEVVKEYQPLSFVLIDKIKLLQILLNLVNNALDALNESNQEKHILTIAVGLYGPETCFISVTDNGSGIKTENLSKIFTYGFSTKETGHGFGLHSSLLLAKELKGSLTVSSAGPDCGATFTLTIPFTKYIKEKTP